MSASVGSFGTFAYDRTDSYYTGKLSSFRIYNRALSDTEVSYVANEFHPNNS